MTWARVDDGFHSHPKARAAWTENRASLGLHFLAISYCADQLTDGHVDAAWVVEKLPVVKERAAAVAALVTAGLWSEVPEGGWLIHDWLDFNPTRDDVLDRRRKDADRKARGRAAQADRPRDVRAESAGNPNGVRVESHDHRSTLSDGPVPTRPDLPTTASGGSDESRERLRVVPEPLRRLREQATSAATHPALGGSGRGGVA